MPLGTHTVADLLENQFQSAADFGVNTIAEVLARDLAAYNEVLAGISSPLAEETTDRQRIYGTSVDGSMLRADEYSRSETVKFLSGATVGFPLYKFDKAVGWTYDYTNMATPRDYAIQYTGIQSLHTQAMIRELRRAIFGSTNFTVRDEFVAPQIDLTVRRFLNADGEPIPNGPDGITFNGATHTHYNFLDGAAPTYAAITTQVSNVAEHGHTANILVNINRAAEATIRAFSASEFTPYMDDRLILSTASNQAAQTVDRRRFDNRAIGLLANGAEVWVRSWVPAGYIFIFDDGAPTRPLVKRIHPSNSVRGLRIVAELDTHPLMARVFDSYFGFGVWQRTNGAVLYYAASASAYVDPTIS